MHILVTGANGFVGRHVVGDLRRAGHTVTALDRTGPPPAGAGEMLEADVCDPDTLAACVRRLSPQACVHLAGIAFPPLGWTDPHRVFSVNLLGTVNLLEAFRAAVPAARLLVVTSAQIYGPSSSPEPLSEDAPLFPADLYSASKAAADLSARLYARRYGMAVLTARPQNHIGPGQSTAFVAPSFAEQLARMAAGQAEPVVRVGNLDSRRDFTDVRDVARAYRLLLEKGEPGEAYNIASGQAVTVRFILEELCRTAGVQPRVETDAARLRPTDAPPPLATEKLRRLTGWQPEIPITRSLQDIYAECAARLARPD